MKKVIKVTLEVDMEHDEIKEWDSQSDAIDSAVKDALCKLAFLSTSVCKNQNGSAWDGMVKYKIHVSNK